MKALSNAALSPTMNRRIRRDFATASERFADFERVFRAIRGRGWRYLQSRAREYRREVTLLQDLIEDPVRSECARCETMCCKLVTPELSIYIAGSIGGFSLVDYLMARCDSSPPTLRYENVDENLCVFWDRGCTLERDHRSFLWLQFFCSKLEKRIDRHAVAIRLSNLSTLLETFSLRVCLDSRD